MSASSVGEIPASAPPIPVEERASWHEKMASLKAVGFPVLIIIIGSWRDLLRVCTPSEAAALGVWGQWLSRPYGKAYLGLDKGICFPDCKLKWNDHLDIDWGLLLHGYLPGIGGRESPNPSDDGYTWRTLCNPGNHAAHLFCPWLHPRSRGHYHDLHARISARGPGSGFRPLWFGVLFCINMEMAYLTPPSASICSI